VSYYRLYFMNSVNGHIERFTELEVATDEEAIQVAQGHQGDCALELWNERRKVARFEPEDLASKLLQRRERARSIDDTGQDEAAAAS
jgi:hypothetical protein